MNNVIQEIVTDSKLHLSARRGLITLIEKTEKDKLNIENWHPILLMCTDYKIFAKIIALRFQEVLPDIIHESQTGFMKGCNIGMNTLKMLALMEYCDKMNQSAVVISFDFRKAFGWNGR